MATSDSTKTDNRIKHGECKDRRKGIPETPEYQSWHAMKQRCYNPSAVKYDRYGGRGITVCHRWRTSFQNFLDDMGRKPSPSHSIDRIDNDGNYEPSNCRWATRQEQTRNTTSTNLLTYNGETLCVTDWAAKIGIAPNTLANRLAVGWPLAKALTAPATPRSNRRARMLTYGNETYSLTEWARRLGINRLTLSDRLRRGWTVEAALTTQVP